MARKTGTVTLADGRVVPIRQLGWLQLKSSRQAAHLAGLAQHARSVELFGGGAAFAKLYRDVRGPAKDDAAQAEAEAPTAPTPDVAAVVVEPVDILDGHDLMTVLVCGIPKWTKEQIENDLDEPEPEVLARAILALSPQPRTEEQEKNAVSPSTDA